jgi:hypothetical protein
MHKPSEHRDGSYCGENKHEGSFHVIFSDYPTTDHFSVLDEFTRPKDREGSCISDVLR